MSVFSTSPDETASHTNVAWQRQLDALLSGECSEDEFMDELSNSPDAGADSAWNVVALLDQRYRLGQVPIDLFRSIEAKIARRELSAQDSGYTIEFEPNSATPRVTTQRLAFGAPIEAPGPSRSSPGVEIGRVLRNRYVLEDELGRGGIGTVFKALDRYRCDLPEGNRHVAIKFLNKKMDGTRIPSNLRREFFCAQALAHPNIVKVYELDLEGDAAFFTMELLDGERLSDRIERLSPSTISRAVAWTIIQQVGAALAHAHSRNVAHGDLKPQNIMMTKSGEVRLLDFGASSALEISSTDATHGINTTALTPAYASCELLEGQPADPRDDLYALACLSYELLSGKHPFDRRRSSEARDAGMLAQRPSGLTHRQWETLRKGLAWNRQDRPMTVRDWLAGLIATPVASLHLKPPRSTPSRRAAALAVASVSIILGLTAWASFRRAGVTAPAAAASSVADDIAPAAASPVPQDIAPTAASSVVQAIRPAAPPAVTQAIGPAARSPIALAAAPLSNSAMVQRADPNRISIPAETYRMRGGQKFAEIQVRRSTGSAADTSFRWWTEPSTAEPGVDYVTQDRITQWLSRGKRSTSLFIRLIPNPARKHPAVFYVVIGEPDDGASLGRARTAVELPSK
jgi:eukaryotic-like serine/threonine-protein kinase